jgi:hypothetical protein
VTCHLTITVSRSASRRDAPPAVFTAVGQNQRDRFGEALPRFFLGAALAVRAGDRGSEAGVKRQRALAMSRELLAV